MMRSVVHFVLLLSLFAVHGAGMARLIDGAVLCIDEAGVAMEDTDASGHCECASEAESASLVELTAPDCVDITLAFTGNLQLTAGGSAPEPMTVTVVPNVILDVLGTVSSGGPRRIARARTTAAPPESAPLAQLRTVILRT